MFSKKSIAVLLLTLTLLVAPATLATPANATPLGWMSSITAFFADILNYFSGDNAISATDRPGKETPPVSNFDECGETGTYPEPSGCP